MQEDGISKGQVLMEDDSKQVSETTSHRAQVRAARRVAEPGVWTDGMLEALIDGVKGGTWYSLMDKLCRQTTLKRAFRRVKANQGAAGVDHQDIEDYERHFHQRIKRLSQKLKEGDYQAQPVRRTWIPKPGRDEMRPLGIPTVQDRIVQMALKMVIEPIFEVDFAEHSYGFRPERSAKDALRRVEKLRSHGYTQVVDADIKGYFDSIPHQPLMDKIEEKISDGRILELIEQFLTQPIVDGDKKWTPERGTPQGGVISPVLANIYLDELDTLGARHGFQMVRYADDFVVMCQTAEEADEALKLIEQWTSRAQLKLHPDKTQVVDTDREGEQFGFLGYRFKDGNRYPRDKSKKRFKEKIREQTRQTNGDSLEVIISRLNRMSRGWFEYFKHCHHNVFTAMDGWIRRRLRSLLRKRQNISGGPNGRDNIRWPNDFFAAKGLFSMEAAFRRIIQSL